MKMTGRIDIELNKQSLDALEIPNPDKLKSMKVPCTTLQAVEEALSTLEILMISKFVLTDQEEVNHIHEQFNETRKQIGIKPHERK